MKIKSASIILILCTVVILRVFSQVETKRELRATWIATVSNLDWPKYEHRNQPDLQKTELIRMLDLYEALNLNAVFLQVRPECDALYNSAYEPWSRYLTWTQGDYPGYDPLQFAIDEAHKRGIELHVWLNPYRINASTNDGGNYYASNHVYVEHPEWAIEYDSGKKILNPGLPEVMSYIGSVVRDIVSNYNIDGVHFDDYFYSYDGTPNSLDQTEYDLYGNGMSRSDWRRDNVNRMIDTVYSVIQQVNPNIRFGVSPFGIYQNGVPSGIYGLDAYSTIYCDPLAWLEDSTVDYITPQLYWPTGGHQDFETLANWWSDKVFANNRHFYAGHGIYRLDNNPGKKSTADLHELKSYFDNQASNTLHEEKLYFDNQSNNYSNLEKQLKGTGDPVADWTLSQVGLQIDMVRNNQAKNGLGSVFFRADDFDRVNGLVEYLSDNKYTHIALMPEMTWKTAQTPVTPTNITSSETLLSWNYAGSENDRFAIYMSFDSVDANSIISEPSNLSKLTFNKEVLLSDLNFSNGLYIVITAVSPIGTESNPSEVYSVDINWPVVELLTPGNNQTVGFEDSLSWQTSDTNAEFYVEISTNSSFSNIVYTTNWISLTSLKIELADLTGEENYYWRVKARTDVEGPFSSAKSFITGFPAVPDLTYPEQLSTNVSTNPIIKWESTNATANIRVVISEDLNFASIIADETFEASPGQGQINRELNQGTWYYVKILAFNEYGESSFSSYRTFETTYGIIPDAILLSPDNNATVSSFDELTWSTTTTTGTIAFLLEVAIDSEFSNTLYNSGWTENTGILIRDLQIQGNTTYYWHVKAKSEFGEGLFTETRSFTTGYPTRPSLIAPGNLSTEINVKPTIEWSVDANTDSVYVEFSEESDFNSVYASELFDANTASGILSASSLKGYTWYYVHISAVNEYGYSVFSSLKYFETGIGNGINELDNNENSLIVYQDEVLNLHLQFTKLPQQTININIYDILGKLVYRTYVINEKQDIKITKPVFKNEGLYLILVKTKNGSVSKKIFIK